MSSFFFDLVPFLQGIAASIGASNVLRAFFKGFSLYSLSSLVTSMYQWDRECFFFRHIELD